MIRSALRLALLPGLLLSGCGMLDAKLQAQTVCYTLPDHPIPGLVGSGAISTEVVYDLGSSLPVLTQPGVSYSLVLKSVAVSVGAGSPPVDLGGIDELTLSAVPPPGASLPEPELVRYVKGADPHPTVITATSSSGLDLASYVAQGQVRLLAQARGSLPAIAWTADVKSCFQLTVDANYGKNL